MTSDTLRVPMVQRINFEFSWDGAKAACLSADERLRVRIERWSLGEEPDVSHHEPLREELGVPSYVLPMADGRILLCYSAPGPVHNVVLVDGAAEVALGAIHCDKLRLRPSPDPRSALITARAGESDGTVWRVDVDTARLTKVCDVPGLQLLGGGWLDTAGRRYAVNQRRADGRVRPVAVDVRSGELTSVLPPSPDSTEILQSTSPAGGLALTASDACGEFRLVVTRLSSGERRVPRGMNDMDGLVYPLAFDDDGRRILLQVSHGVLQRLVLYDLDSDETTEVPVPLGALCGPVRFVGDGLRMAYSTPHHPPDIVDVPLRGIPPVRISPSDSTGARLESFPGPEGPIEAVVHGYEDWRDARHVLVALHGGPEDHWSPRFDTLFAALATAGVTVIAPNQRGSTRYGPAHQAAIRGAWGGPDLADVCALAGDVAAQRRFPESRLLLYGISYGAYLALLAAAVRPGLWSACAVVAPFLSAPRLYQEAGPKVRLLIDRLDGLTEIADAIGPRDLFRLAPEITSKLLIIHGDQDPVVPVTQSRALCTRLRAVGRRDGVDFVYREIPGEGHNPVFDIDGKPVRELISQFLLDHPAGERR